MKIQDLVGKTITSATLMKYAGHSDEPAIRLTFSDGTACDIEGAHNGDYDPKAKDEYPNFIYVEECDKDLIPVNDEVYHAVSAANGVDTTDWIGLRLQASDFSSVFKVKPKWRLFFFDQLNSCPSG